MLFNSYGFLFIFLPAVLLVYWVTPSLRGRKWISVIASYIFYGAWSAKFALLMLATTSVDFFTARWIDRAKDERVRKFWLALSMVTNLGVLAVFKYYNFFADSLNSVVPEPFLPILNVVLPIGISFYTFESMSYTIDVYKRHIPALDHFVDYAHFVTMFPRLVAGPIARYTDMAAQMRELPRWLPSHRIVTAIHFFTIGLAKKVLIADFIAANLVAPLFRNPEQLNFATGWTAAIAYTVQLYFDFSGYSDMAVGLAHLLGFELPRNFAKPYGATSIQEFWHRWHISLSTWLRDYLYIPLGGNRHGKGRQYLNLFLTMLLGGLWHGANWTFVLWGAFHGGSLVIYHALRKRLPDVPKVVGIGTTMLLVVIGWVMFRADHVHHAWAIYRAMLGLNGWGLAWVQTHVGYLAILGAALLLSMTVDTYDLKPNVVKLRWAVAYGLLLVASILMFSAPSPFLYFQF